MTTRHRIAPLRAAAVLAGSAIAMVAAAGTASAADTVDIVGATPTAIRATYTCAPEAGVTGVKAMVGGPAADRPGASGAQLAITCDGTQQTATIELAPEPGEPPLQSGALVQARVALVDRDDIVVAGQAKVFQLQG